VTVAARSPMGRPALLPSTVLRAAGSRIFAPVFGRDMLYGLLLVVATYYLLRYASVPLAALAIGVAGWQTWLRWNAAEKSKGWLNVRRSLCILGIIANLALPLIALGHTTIASLFCLAAVEFLLHRPTPPELRQAWWKHTTLATALVAAKVLPRPGRDDPNPLPTLRYVGRPGPLDDGTGSQATVLLPAGASYSDVDGKVRPLASALGVAEHRLIVTHDPHRPANEVTLFVSAGTGKHTLDAPSPLLAADRTSFYEPVPVGRTVRGVEVTIDLFEHNTMAGGLPGYGKTTTVRAPLAAVLKDPSAYLFGGDGKGSRADYAPVAALAEAWVWGTDEDPAQALLDKVLRPVLAIVRARNACEHEPDGGWPGVLLLLEEFQEFRAAAEPDTLAELDATHKRIIRMGRAVAVHDLISSQRPTVDDVPSSVRNLVGQNICHRVRSSDAPIVLGTSLTVPMPMDKGQAVLGDATGQVSYHAYNITREDLRRVCEHATALRREAARPDPLEQAQILAGTRLAPVVSLVKVSATAVAPLDAAVLALLRDAGTDGMTASELLSELPGALAPKTTAALGVRLKVMADTAGSVRRARRGRSWAWFNPSDNPSEPGSPTPRVARLTPRSEGLYGDEHAQMGPERHLVSVPSELRKAMP